MIHMSARRDTKKYKCGAKKGNPPYPECCALQSGVCQDTLRTAWRKYRGETTDLNVRKETMDFLNIDREEHLKGASYAELIDHIVLWWHMGKDHPEDDELSMKEQWSRKIQREIISRFTEPSFTSSEISIKGSLFSVSLSRVDDYSRRVKRKVSESYSPEEVEEARRENEEWNSVGMELLDLIQRWAEEMSET